MTAIHIPKDGPPPVNPTKDGEGFDRCPKDGCVEVDRSFKNGGKSANGENYLDWAMFHADPKVGGCGENWARTTRQGIARDHKRGVNPKWRTRSADRESFQLSTSELYRIKYDCAFARCGCVLCEAGRADPKTRKDCTACLEGQPVLPSAPDEDSLFGSLVLGAEG